MAFVVEGVDSVVGRAGRGGRDSLGDVVGVFVAAVIVVVEAAAAAGVLGGGRERVGLPAATAGVGTAAPVALLTTSSALLLLFASLISRGNRLSLLSAGVSEVAAVVAVAADVAAVAIGMSGEPKLSW